MPVVLAALSASLLGFGDFFAGYGSRRTEHHGASVSIAWIASIVGATVAGLYLLVFPPEAFTAADLRWSLIAMVFSSMARPLLYRCMEVGPMAVAAPVIGIVSLVIPAVVGPLTGTSLGGLELLGVLVAAPAVVLIVAEGALPSIAMMRSSPVLGLSATTGVAIGLMALCLAEIQPEAEATPAFVTQLGAVVLVPLFARPFQKPAPISRDIVGFALLVGVIDIIAIIASTIAFQRGNVAVVAAIMGCAPAPTIALAWRVHGDAVRSWQWLGAALAVGAVVLFALAS